MGSIPGREGKEKEKKERDGKHRGATGCSIIPSPGKKREQAGKFPGASPCRDSISAGAAAHSHSCAATPRAGSNREGSVRVPALVLSPRCPGLGAAQGSQGALCPWQSVPAPGNSLGCQGKQGGAGSKAASEHRAAIVTQITVGIGATALRGGSESAPSCSSSHLTLPSPRRKPLFLVPSLHTVVGAPLQVSCSCFRHWDLLQGLPFTQHKEIHLPIKHRGYSRGVFSSGNHHPAKPGACPSAQRLGIPPMSPARCVMGTITLECLQDPL